MPIDIDVAHVARLARLALTDEELEHYGRQLSVILDHAAEVQAYDTDGIIPTSHPLALKNAHRVDEVTASLDRDEVLREAPSAVDGMFRVPPSLETE